MTLTEQERKSFARIMAALEAGRKSKLWGLALYWPVVRQYRRELNALRWARPGFVREVRGVLDEIEI